jgi:Rrf2 family protein
MLSSKAKYGLKAMVYLARHEAEGPSVIMDISTAERLPKKFLDVILLELKNNGLLTSKKGKGGGYSLAKSADSIRIGDIVRILDGPLAPVPCVSRLSYRRCEDCVSEELCAVRIVMQEVRDAIAAVLDTITLAQMASNNTQTEAILNYDI